MEELKAICVKCGRRVTHYNRRNAKYTTKVTCPCGAQFRARIVDISPNPRPEAMEEDENQLVLFI